MIDPQSEFSMLLDPLDADERAALLGCLRARHYGRGQAVFNDGDVGDCVHFVTSGRFEVHVSTLDGQTVMLRVVQPGEFFGELALVHPGRQRTGRVCALEPAESLALYQRDFDELRLRQPGVDRFLVAALAERVIRTTELVLELMLPPGPRVWRRLHAFANAYGEDPIRMTQDDLAHAAGTVRQTVNRVLQVGVNEGILRLGRGTIEVIDRQGLERRSSGSA